MKDEDKTKEQLLEELIALRGRISNLGKQPPEAQEIWENLDVRHDARPPNGELAATITETIDLTTFLTKDISRSGSFDIRGDVWKTTFGKLLQALPVPSLLLDSSLVVVFLNEAWAQITPSYHRVQGMPFTGLFSRPSSAEKARSLVESIFSTRKSKVAQAMLTIDNVSIWCQMAFRPVRIMKERFVLVIVDDLSRERKEIENREKTEKKLRESEERYRELVENSNDIVFQIDTKGFFTFVNSAACRISGYSEKELVGLHFTDLIVPEYREETAKFYGRQLVKKIPSTYYEFPFETKNGEVKWVGQNVQSIMREDEIVGFQSITRDITDRKKAEESLRNSEERYKLLLGSVTDYIYTVQVQDGRQLATVHGPGCTAVTGYTPEDYAADAGLWYRMVYEPDRAAVTDQSANVLAGKAVSPLEHRLIHRDGSIRWVRNTPVPRYDLQQHLIAYDGLIKDITESRRVEDALKESEHRYRTLFEESIDGVYSVLRNGEITDANAALCELFGYTRQEMLGKDVRELYVNPADHLRFQKEIEKKGFVKDYEIKFRKRDGTEVDCLLSSSVRFGRDGSIAGYRGIARDLTSHKALQGQLFQAQKMEAIGTLAGGIAHDFNNLLQVTLGYSELLLSEKSSKDPDYADLQKIHQAARSGAELVRNLLTFSKKVEPKVVPMDLNNQIRHIEKLLHRAIAKMIEIRMELGEGLKRVHADPGQIEQIVMNLAVNARDAMGEQGTLTIQTENVFLDEEYCRHHVEAKPGDHVLLKVSDTGSGMDQQTLQHIFEPFYTTKEVGRGTGLGLAMVYGIVKQHGGHLTCYSEVGTGTTFKLYFPAIPSIEEPAVEDTGVMPAFGTETVLLVDDEDFVRDLGERILTKNGYTVLTAANGEEALEVYNREKDRIALIILDLFMPTMGGKDCLKRILDINPHTKVLLSSGYSADASMRECIELGAKGFVAKPFRFKELLRQVRKALDES